MSYTVVLNACGNTLREQAQEMRAFLLASNLVPDGRAILLCTDGVQPADIIQEVPAAEVMYLRLAAYQPENALAALTEILSTVSPELLLFSGDYAGRELAVRLACRLQGSSLVGVCALKRKGAQITYIKSAYAANMQATLTLSRLPACISVTRGRRASAQECEKITEKHMIAQQDYTNLHKDASFLERRYIPAAQTTGLQNASFVLAAGRGVKNQADTDHIAAQAAMMGAEFGVSRPLAMHAWAPLDRLIGVSGHMLAPKLCIAVGISGAGAFLAGVAGAERLIAINTDANAAIMKAADVAVIGSYDEILTELAALFQQSSTPISIQAMEDEA